MTLSDRELLELAARSVWQFEPAYQRYLKAERRLAFAKEEAVEAAAEWERVRSLREQQGLMPVRAAAEIGASMKEKDRV